MFAPMVDLPPRAEPPLEAIVVPSLAEVYQTGSRITRKSPPHCWSFTITPGETLRIGPLSMQIRPGPAQVTDEVRRMRDWRPPPPPARQHVHLDLAWPLPQVLSATVSIADDNAVCWVNWEDRDSNTVRMVKEGPKPTDDLVTADVSIPLPRPGSYTPLLKITIDRMHTSLIEVTCIT